MKFETLDELISFERGMEWKNMSEMQLSNYKAGKDVALKYDRLRNQRYAGIYGDTIVSVVSDQFSIISVEEIAKAAESVFGAKFTEKSYKDGIVRIYEAGAEDRTGKVMPMVIYPANLGTMAVKIGLYHNAYVCSNGMIIAGNVISQKIIHRLRENEIKHRIELVSDKLGTILTSVEEAKSYQLDKGLQLAMLVKGLEKKDKLVSQALVKYPAEQTLWETVQTITSIATHKTRDGFEYARNAGELLLNRGLSPVEIVDAASYVFSKEKSNTLRFENSNALYELAIQQFHRTV